MNDHSSRRSGAPWPAEDQPSSRREARSQRPVRRSRSRLGLLAGPAALLVVGAGLAATGISHAANDPATQDVVAPAAARGANAVGARRGHTPTTTTTATVTGAPATTVANGGNNGGGNGNQVVALNGRDHSPFRLRHRHGGGGFQPTPTSTTTLAPGTVDPNCVLVVPANPLSAKGLATPYVLKPLDPGGTCTETNPLTSAFVQGAIVTRDGNISLYNPLVIGDGETAAPTITPTVPAGATVALWFGFNGDTLALESAKGTDALRQGNCVDGLRGSIFGQFSYCNAPEFFRVANQANLQIPALGTATDGKPCPTVRDFSVVDQDQSDNVTTHYWSNNGVIGQQGSSVGGTDLINGSDNLLLTGKIDPALGCTPWKVSDQSNNGALGTSLPLDELQAAAYQANPKALMPLNDPMTMVGTAVSVEKTNLYRAGVDQPLVGGTGLRLDNAAPAFAGAGQATGNGANNGRRRRPPTGTPTTSTSTSTTATSTTTGTATGLLPAGLDIGNNGDPATYCKALFFAPEGIARVFAAETIYRAWLKTPNLLVGANLFTFLAARASESFANLNCANYGLSNPITLTQDGNALTTAATYNPAVGTTPAPVTATTTSTSTSASTSTSVSTSTSTSTSVPVVTDQATQLNNLNNAAPITATSSSGTPSNPTVTETTPPVATAPSS